MADQGEKHPNADPQGGRSAKKARPPPLPPIAEDAAAADVVAEAEPKAPHPSDPPSHGYLFCFLGTDEAPGADDTGHWVVTVPWQLIEKLPPFSVTKILDHSEAPKIDRPACDDGSIEACLGALSGEALACLIGSRECDDPDEFDTKLTELGHGALGELLGQQRRVSMADVPNDPHRCRTVYLESYE
jgi:hypothetical protein